MNIPFPFIFLLTIKVIRFYRCDLNRVKHTEGGHKSDCKNVSGYKVKRDYKNCDVYITPTMKEIDELMEVKPEIIAIDATSSLRPNGVTLFEMINGR